MHYVCVGLEAAEAADAGAGIPGAQEESSELV